MTPTSAAKTKAAAAPGAGGRCERITSAGALEAIERIRTAQLVGDGLVNVIALDAIRRKLAEQWPRKAPRVWEHLERELARTLGPTGVFVRLDDVDYLVAQPGDDAFAAQALCLRVLQEVLTFFLGELRPSDLIVRTVTSLDGGVVASAPLDLARLRPGAPTRAAAAPLAEGSNGPLADHAPAPKPWKPPLEGRLYSLALAPPKRSPFTLQLRVDPVWNLKRGRVTSFVIDRSGGPPATEAADLEEIDAATLAYVASLLDEQPQQGGGLVLHAPINFATLATQRSRERLIRLTGPVREPMRACVLLEIDGLDSGVPPSRLIEVVGLVRGLCAGVLARVRPRRSALEAVRDCGLRGLVAQAAWLGAAGRDSGARLHAYARLARDITPNVLVHALPRMDLIDQAAAAGFTHASAPHRRSDAQIP
jgi:hypothetical protein